MGKRGPLPTPSPILQARGSWRANQNKREPKPPPGRPICPAWLPKEAKRVWRGLIPILESMKVLTQADRSAIARYCVLSARWRAAEEFIAKHGDTYPRKKFNVQTQQFEVVGFSNYPHVRTADHLASQLAKLEASFGLTPSARSRIETTDGEDEIEKPSKAAFIAFGKRSGA